MLLNRKQLQELEEKNLAPYAIKSSESKGRQHPEKAEKYRLCFQKDKERIIHSKAFRRLDRKTQVLMAGTGDHYRTRLTHTLEVAQIARGVARLLGLNEDLCEVIALAHDLGHPPFGHTGEEILDQIMQEYGHRFEHNLQSKRVVEALESPYPGIKGLNLSKEVLEGLIKHQSAWDQSDKQFEQSPHLEAQIVNIADEIAYTNHDIDDGLRSGAFKINDLEEFQLWQDAKKEVHQHYGPKLKEHQLVSRTISTIFSKMIEDLCKNTEKNIKKYKIDSVQKIRESSVNIADFSPPIKKKLEKLRNFLYKEFYFNKKVRKAQLEGQKMIKTTFKFLMENPQELHPKTKKIPTELLAIIVKDFIAGMTDDYLVDFYEKSIKTKNEIRKSKQISNNK